MFKNFFKGKDKNAKALVEQMLQDLLEKAGFSLSAEVTEAEDGGILVNLFGEDEGLLKIREGRLIVALQTYFNRVVQHHFLDQNIFVRMDSGNFFEEKEQKMLDLAERLKQKALATGRPVYFKKALSPFQRRKVHQFLTEKGEVKTSSTGEGFYKYICISPLNSSKK